MAFTDHSVQALTPTISGLFGIVPPNLCIAPPIVDIQRAAQAMLHGETIQKCLIFAPDALGNHLFAHYSSLFESVIQVAPHRVSLQSVVPPKTPVCFASMFTGATPAQHGIRKYEKPVLTCDTLFDALIRANKRVAIVAVENCSIDLIFRNREIDYFSESYDPEVTRRTIALIKENRHDLILAYHQEYDDTMHATTPFDPRAIQAIKNNINGFVEMSEAFNRYWQNYNRAIVFSPDHGAHLDPLRKKGDHGEDISEDMELNHYYGFQQAISKKVRRINLLTKE
ncbi:MAG: hypothetical protein GXO75_02440 [Calditrichaeota bacterium]|nr:hypothetical protein [Calditrichota bacterium]